MSELIVDKIAPNEGNNLTLSSSNVEIIGDITTKGNINTPLISLQKNKLDIPVLVLKDTSNYGFSYITDQRNYDQNKDEPGMGIKFQSNPDIGIGGKVVVGSIATSIPSIQMSSGSTRTINAFADTYYFTSYPGDLSSATTNVRIQDEKIFLSSKHGKIGQSYVNNHIGSESLIISGNVKIHGSLLVDTFISGGNNTVLINVNNGSIHMTPNIGAPFFGNTNDGKLSLNGGTLNEDQGQPSIISSGSLTLGIGGTGSAANPFFSIISGAVGGPDAIMKPDVASQKLFFIDHLGRITASNSVSASGNLFASTSISPNAAFQTIVIDTASGQFYYTGSYGNPDGGEETTTFVSLTDTPEVIPVNQYLVSNGSGELTFAPAPPTDDLDWHQSATENLLTSSKSTFVSGAITASGNIRLGVLEGSTSTINSNSTINFGTAGSPYGGDGSRLMFTDTPLSTVKGIYLTSERKMVFGNGGLYYWTNNVNHSASNATMMVLNTKGFLGVSQIPDYWGKALESSEENNLPAALSVIGNISASDGGSTGGGGFLNISASQANVVTNNLVHDPITGRVFYDSSGGTGADGADLDWRIDDISNGVDEQGRGWVVPHNAAGNGIGLSFTGLQGTAPGRHVLVQGDITGSGNGIWAQRAYYVGFNTTQTQLSGVTQQQQLAITNNSSYGSGISLGLRSENTIIQGRGRILLHSNAVTASVSMAATSFDVRIAQNPQPSLSGQLGSTPFSENASYVPAIEGFFDHPSYGSGQGTFVQVGNASTGLIVKGGNGPGIKMHSMAITMSQDPGSGIDPDAFYGKCNVTMSGHLSISASDAPDGMNVQNLVRDPLTGKIYYGVSNSSDGLWNLGTGGNNNDIYFDQKVAIGTSSFSANFGSPLYVANQATTTGDKSAATFASNGSGVSILFNEFSNSETANKTASLHFESQRISIGNDSFVSSDNLNIQTTTNAEFGYEKGNVGIGTNAIPEKLTVNGNISSSRNLILRNSSTPSPGNLESFNGIIFNEHEEDNTNQTAIYNYGTNNQDSLYIQGSGSIYQYGRHGDIMLLTGGTPQPEFQALNIGLVVKNHGDGTNTVGINTAFPDASYELEVNGDTNMAGDLYIQDVNLLSDQRLKENIKDLEPQLENIKKLQPRKYDWKERDNSNDVGFIAQEVKEVIPKLVTEGKNKDKTLSVNYIKMVPLLVKGMQEQQELIEKLSIKIDELEKKLNN